MHMLQVSQGEGGARMAIEQLNEEKQSLLEKIAQLTNALKEEVGSPIVGTFVIEKRGLIWYLLVCEFTKVEGDKRPT